jgi:hypothetical protein
MGAVDTLKEIATDTALKAGPRLEALILLRHWADVACNQDVLTLVDSELTKISLDGAVPTMTRVHALSLLLINEGDN